MGNNLHILNEILMRRKNEVILPILEKGEISLSNRNERKAATIVKNFEAYGYTVSQELYSTMCEMPDFMIGNFYLDTVQIIKELTGADVKHEPMYPNFPNSVMKRSDFRLYVNALMHYWSNGVLYPVEEKKERLPLFDTTTVRVIQIGSYSELRQIFKNLCQSKTSISQTDREDLIAIYQNLRVIDFPNEIPLKENVAVIGKILVENGEPAGTLCDYIKTATDILRVITAMSNGDISLSENCKYRSFKRRERKVLLYLLEECSKNPSFMEDMNRYKKRWIRIGERLHPGEYTDCCPNTAKAFEKLRAGEKIETFAGKVEKCMEEKDIKAAVDLLKTRPGEFARRLDQMLVIASAYPNCDELEDMIQRNFKDVSAQVSTPVLLQVREHFTHRNEADPMRVFFPKGSLAKSYAINETRSPLKPYICAKIIEICEKAIMKRFVKDPEKKNLGKVWISEELKDYTVPFSQRSASKTVKAVTRGSRISVPQEKQIIRPFIWWTNQRQNHPIDIDLSCVVYNENWNQIAHCSYTEIKNDRFGLWHSGDIVDGGDPDGAGVSEFIDVDINEVTKNGGRYVAFEVYCYSEVPFKNMTNLRFGWMIRESMHYGEIFDARTVEQQMDLATNAMISVPVIFDCVKRQMVWCDMSVRLAMNGYGENNLENNLKGATATCYAMVNMKKPNLYDLFWLNAIVRGKIVEKREDADIAFALKKEKDSDVTPFDTDRIVAEFL